MQVMCVFVAAKISAIFSQQYLPFYFLDTLKMNKVDEVIVIHVHPSFIKENRV